MSEFDEMTARDAIRYGERKHHQESGTSAGCYGALGLPGCPVCDADGAAIGDLHWLLTEIVEPLLRVLESGRYVAKVGSKFTVCERSQPVCHGYFDTLTKALAEFKAT